MISGCMKATVIIVSMLFGMNVCAVASDIIVRGQVLDVSGKPVSDVMVTDGFSITHTDMYGAYEIRPDKFSDYVTFTFWNIMVDYLFFKYSF